MPKELIHVVRINGSKGPYYYNIVAPDGANMSDIANKLLLIAGKNRKFLAKQAKDYNFSFIKTTTEPFPDCANKFDNTPYHSLLNNLT